MKYFLALAAFIAAVSFARADLTITQKVEGSGQSGDQTIKIKGDKARTDLAQHVTMITDGATGDIVTLMHAQKSFMKIPAAQTKTMMEQLQKMRGTTETPKLEPTGKKEKVGSYDCDVFTCNLGAMSISYWLAKDFPDYQAVLAQMEKMQAGAISAMAKGAMPEMKDFPGMPIKTEIDLGGKKVTTTLVSATEGNVDPAIFNIPGDYKEITAPDLSFPAAK